MCGESGNVFICKKGAFLTIIIAIPVLMFSWVVFIGVRSTASF